MTYEETKNQGLKEFEKVAWHEVDCPAHSNQMRPESECNCVYSSVKSFLTTVYSAGHKAGVEEKSEALSSVNNKSN